MLCQLPPITRYIMTEAGRQVQGQDVLWNPPTQTHLLEHASPTGKQTSGRGCLQGPPGMQGPPRAGLLAPNSMGSLHLGNAPSASSGVPTSARQLPTPSLFHHLAYASSSRQHLPIPLLQPMLPPTVPPALTSECLRSQEPSELLTKPMAPALENTQPADTEGMAVFVGFHSPRRTLSRGVAGTSGFPGPGRATPE